METCKDKPRNIVKGFLDGGHHRCMVGWPMFNERPRREVWMQMGGRAETQTGDRVLWALLVCVPFCAASRP